jgi:hypothetical protein
MLGINLDPLAPLLKNQKVQLAIALFVGITIGALFYPTKSIEEKVSKKYEQQISTLNQVHSQELQASKQELDKVTSQSQTLQAQSQEQISQLTTQVHDLQSSKKTTYYKIVHPDGTVEIRETTDAESQEEDSVATQVQAEYQQKLSEATSQLEKTHQDEITTLEKSYTSKAQAYEETISSLQKSKTVEINQKTTSVEGGLMNDKDYYVHAQHDLWGPVFLGGQGEAGQAGGRFGLGIGIRF